MKREKINHPRHYNAGGIEVIDAIEAWKLNFHLGNAVKYIARADHKGTRLDDLKKARWYLDREIARAAPKKAPRRRPRFVAPDLHVEVEIPRCGNPSCRYFRRPTGLGCTCAQQWVPGETGMR